MTSQASDALESAASQAAEPPPAGHAPTADSSASDRERLSPTHSVGGDGPVGGGRGERVSARGRRPLRGGSGAAPPSGASEAAPSLLDTYATTRPAREKSAARDAWIGEVAKETAEHREAKACAFDAKARTKLKKARVEGFSEGYAHDAGAWYKTRARGQRERLERVRACGGTVLEIMCIACGKRHERAQGCRVALLCLQCRGSIASEKRIRFLGARKVTLDEATKRGLLIDRRRGGRWSEKFLTLTAPHFAEDTIISRIERIAAAWPRFLRKLNRHFREIDARSWRFFRCLEWACERDPLGHPHIHLWIFSPYLNREDVEAWWTNSLREVCEHPFERAFIDLREATRSDGGANELIKYLTKDIDAAGKKIPPDVYAEVYKAFDGRRVTQASSGFMSLGEKNLACECGATVPKRVRKMKPEAQKNEANP